MTINLPDDLASRVQSVVRSGRFASIDDAMVEAARLLLREPADGRPPTDAGDSAPDPISGLMRDDMDLMDEIVADAYRHRRDELSP